MAAPIAKESVQCFGRKKTAVAVTHCKRGRGLIKINGKPIELVEPEILRYKAFEPILLLGRHRFAGVDMRIRVKGGGHTSQIYAIRQSIAKALVAFYQKYVDEQSKKEIKDILGRYDRTLLVADPRRCEPKKFGGRGARARVDFNSTRQDHHPYAFKLVLDSLFRLPIAQSGDVRDGLINGLNGSPNCPDVSCIVSDGVMSFTLDAAEQLRIPEVVFFTSSACGFMGYCHFPELVARGLFPLAGGGLGCRNEEHQVNYDILQTRNAAKANAVILNTFDDLEREVLDAIREKFETVVTIEPRAPGTRVKPVEGRRCFDSLARRPGPNSILYVNFGSITVLSPEQLLEFAGGLANSNQHFLWIIRPDLVSSEEAVLPEEVKVRGEMVWWCSQERVLAHPAVGGFLTHCGWNSTLEALSEGSKAHAAAEAGGSSRRNLDFVDQSDFAETLDWKFKKLILCLKLL
ncbi:hypothetical protein SASPL_115481 [Salvia splendens]|uniref:Small subunit ribosomal protein S16e n=1 Tax=Salvia splendens TaxID=180675 RepID=A0A8X8Y840_SALSN|nr:hypothetical protein SASPL_115481 [Salvia splendens]